ncbi:MAG: hypothetical protein K2Q22_09915 [Cytophagales bacterium]|nr:hypothetical protein [Cytophagales bacterium]
MATFKSIRLINTQTVETVGPRSLQFAICHRFGDFTDKTFYNFLGFDQLATIRFSLDYSYNGRLQFGLARNGIGKLYEFNLKYKLLRQTEDNSMPISLTIAASANLNSTVASDNRYNLFFNRVSYVSQIILARKFSPGFSFQVAPIWIHYNLVGVDDPGTTKNDMFAVQFGTRLKLTKRFALTAEFITRPSQYSSSTFYNSAGIGVDIETGGHVFQIFFTNSSALNETQFIPYTTNDWTKPSFRLGFNLTRSFRL